MKRKRQRLFTSEAACMGHPDKVCDQVSDAILDELLKQDPNSRVAVETLAKSNLVVIAGEVTTKGYVEMQDIVRKVICDIGYDDPSKGFDGRSVGVLNCISRQSPDIALGVDEKSKEHAKELGAGDQGIMFGYACNETPELMPMPIHFARCIVNRAADVRMEKVLPYLRPDGKTQITIQYENDRPVRAVAVVLSLQHADTIDIARLRSDLLEHVIKPAAPPGMIDKETKFYINPTGRFVEGGPAADCGLTGRKVVVDTYGSMGTHGGGAFSGKDPTKVDRSGSYAARYAAKNIVAAGLADRCEVQLAYAIGVPEPVAIDVETFGTAKIAEEKIVELAKKHFSFSVSGMIEHLDLRRPIFLNTARYGHFGIRDDGRKWERTDKAQILKKEAGI